MKNRLFFICAILASSTCVYAQSGNVGIGTSTPSNKLHLNGTNPLRLQGVQASTSNGDKALVIDNNGVVKTGLNDQSMFSGHITSDLAVAAGITKIIVQNELVDKGAEYNPVTGLFSPAVSGVYEFEIQITLNCPTASTAAYGQNSTIQRGVMGFANNATNTWVGRFNFQLSVDDRATYAKGVASLVAGQSYYFGVATSGVPSTVVSNPTGGSGSGLGTYFSVKRIQ